jgi:phosphoribosylaminoimidazole carboxylase PurE protein
MDEEISGPLVSIVMGSKSDLPLMQASMDILSILKVPYEMDIVSAHRTPKKMYSYAQEVETRGVKVVIAGAGGAAHLPGMIAAMTILPVVGVPIPATKLEGLDSLLSIVQMPAGVPVATVAIGNAENAGLLAAKILATSHPRFAAAIKTYKEKLESKVDASSLANKTVYLP